MRYIQPFFSVIIILSIIASCSPISVFAATSSTGHMYSISDDDFDPNAILNDDDILSLGSMGLADIQDFLSLHGVLDKYRTKDIDGVEKNASDIIWRVATSYKVNPRYLLALIQKEQSLVEDPNPSQKQFDWATGYGVCDSCSMDDPSIQDFRGFAAQLEWAAKQHRERYFLQILIRGMTITGLAPGRMTKIDGKTVTPVNNATAMLYSYTPHIHGNLNLWRIWQRWFSFVFPEGTIVRGNSSKQIYLLRYGQKRPFQNLAVASSMIDNNKIISVDDVRLASYSIGKQIKFANYSLVETPDNKRFLLAGEKKRLILNDQAFRKFGFNEDELITADVSDLTSYTDGPDITTLTTNPTGLLMKDNANHFWYVEDNERHALPDPSFMSLYFKGRIAKLWTTSKINATALGAPYQLRDGELVRDKKAPSVYVIEQGKRRPILSGADFEELGYQWKNIISLPEKVLLGYSIGDPVLAHPLMRDSSTLAKSTEYDDSVTVASSSQILSLQQ